MFLEKHPFKTRQPETEKVHEREREREREREVLNDQSAAKVISRHRENREKDT